MQECQWLVATVKTTIMSGGRKRKKNGQVISRSGSHPIQSGNFHSLSMPDTTKSAFVSAKVILKIVFNFRADIEPIFMFS